MQYGASRYERDNWRKIPAEEHFNHMMIHALAYLSGDTQDDHLGHCFYKMYDVLRNGESGGGDAVSSPRYDWWPYVKGMIRRYPAT